MAKLPGNSICCDCNCKRVSWASINIGCFLCYECAGQHRNLGTHISQVRSLTLDRWKPQWLDNMIGNEAVNKKYLARLPADKHQPDEHDQSGREHWIKQKYQDKKWYSNVSDVPASTSVPVVSESTSTQQVQQQPQQQPQQDLFMNIFSDQPAQSVQQQIEQVPQQQVQIQQPVQQQNNEVQETESVKQSSSTQQQMNALDDLLGIFGDPVVEQTQQPVQKKRLQFDW